MATLGFGCGAPKHDGTSPSFRGLTSAIVTGPGTVHLTWAAATDDTTPSTEVTYDVYVGTTSEVVPSASTLFASLVGKNDVGVSGLGSGTGYKFAVVASDAAGNRTDAGAILALTVPSSPLVVAPETLVVDGSAPLGPPTVAGTQYTFKVIGAGVLPTEGSIIVGQSSDGGGYLRRVTAATRSGDDLLLDTTSASLDEALTSGAISASVRPFEDDSVASAAAADSSRIVDPGWLPTGSSFYADRGRDGVRVITQQTASASTSGSATGEIGADIDVSTDPILTTQLEWGPGGVISGELVATGAFDLVAKVTFDFVATGDASKQVHLFDRSYLVRYVIGGVPVFHEITLSIDLALSATATAALSAGATLTKSFPYQIGIRFDPQTRSWAPVADVTQTSAALEPVLTMNGSAQGTVRVLPKITSRFYGALAVEASFEPVLQATIAADNVKLPPGVPLALKRFDVGLFGECYLSANLTILSKTFSVLDRTRVCLTPQFTLFSVPTVTLASAPGPEASQYRLSATVQDGTLNPLDASSIRWLASTGSFDAPLGHTSVTYTLELPSETVFFSAASRLGEPGRMYFPIDVSCLSDLWGTYTRDFDLGDHSRESYVLEQENNSVTGFRHRWDAAGNDLYMTITGALSIDSCGSAHLTGTGVANGTPFTFTGEVSNGRLWWTGNATVTYPYGNASGLACLDHACDGQ